MITFGQFIKQKRVEAKLTQRDIADYLGYASYAMISMLEGGERYWQLDHVVKLAKLFDVPVWKLIKEWREN